MRSAYFGATAAAALAMAVVCASGAAWGQAPVFDIEAQPLAEALVEFSREADVTVTAPSRLTEGKTANAVRGTMPAVAALEALIAGSGLEVRRDPSGALIVVEPASEAPTEIEKPAPEPDMPAPPAEAATDKIIVTGTRIGRTDGFSAPSPLTVVDSEQIENSGFLAIDDVLLRTPLLGPGLGSANSRSSEDAGAAFINLRGLGVNRSLVVVNGRRRVSGSSTSSAVDLNTIPASMIERVEILTGGASAIYGADAVSGVVNIITRTDFEGLEFFVAGGISEEWDAERASVGLQGGALFDDDRGNLNFGLIYRKEARLNAIERSFGQLWPLVVGNPANTGPNDGIPDTLTVRDTRLNYVTDGANFYVGGAAYQYGRNGLEPITGTVMSGTRTAALSGGNAAFFPDFIDLRSPIEETTFRGELNYSILPNVSFFAEAEFAVSQARSSNDAFRFDERPPLLLGRGGPRIRRDNAFLPTAVAALMDANRLTELPVRRRLDDFGDVDIAHDRSTYTIVTGVEGELADWAYEAFFQYGANRDDIESPNLPIASRFLFAVDAVVDPASGRIVCRDLQARAAGCVPYDIFSFGPLSPEFRNYAVHTRIQQVENTQLVSGASLNGALFELPSGPVSLAAGIEYREETLETRDDGLSLAGELLNFGVGAPRLPIDAGFDVIEGFAEIRAPLLRDLPLVKEFEIEGALRVSDYSTIGATTAWKAGASWAPFEDIRLRYSRSRSVRAPNLNELYGPQNISAFNITPDPCDASRLGETPNRRANCAAFGFPTNFKDSGALSTLRSGGNPALQEEISDSYTFGLVFTPDWETRLRVSIDYWNFEIEDAITRFSPEEVLRACFDADEIANNIFCGQIEIASNFDIGFVDATDINVSRLSASGVDAQADLDVPLRGGHAIHASLQGTYLLKKERLADPARPSTLIIDDGEYTDPTLRLNFILSYMGENWRVGAAARYVSASSLDEQATPERFDIAEIGERFYTDLTFGYSVSERADLIVGVNNIFDVDPPFSALTYLGGSTNGGDARASLYDNVGRYVHASMRVRF